MARSAYCPRKPGISNRTAWVRRTLLVAAALLPVESLAQVVVTRSIPTTQAFTTAAVNLRAGPDRSFPLVSWLQGGTPVTVFGCLNGWHWCDVAFGFNRGWVYGRFLAIPFNGQQVLIMNSGPRFGVPMVTFSVGPYWGAHYRGRPWYHQGRGRRPRPPRGGASAPTAAFRKPAATARPSSLGSAAAGSAGQWSQVGLERGVEQALPSRPSWTRATTFRDCGCPTPNAGLISPRLMPGCSSTTPRSES